MTATKANKTATGATDSGEVAAEEDSAVTVDREAEVTAEKEGEAEAVVVKAVTGENFEKVRNAVNLPVRVKNAQAVLSSL